MEEKRENIVLKFMNQFEPVGSIKSPEEGERIGSASSLFSIPAVSSER